MTTPAASRAATLPDLPEPVMADGEELEEPIVQGDYYTAEQMRAYALAALEAAQPASPAPLTAKQFMEIMRLHDEAAIARRELKVGGNVPKDEADNSRATRRRLSDYVAALASPQVAPAPKYIQRMDGQMVTGKDHLALQPAKIAAPVQVAPHLAYLEARDAILHDRGPLEGEGMTSEQTNAVLAVLDDAFAAVVQVAPPQAAEERVVINRYCGAQMCLVEDEAHEISCPKYSKPTEPTQGEQSQD